MNNNKLKIKKIINIKKKKKKMIWKNRVIH